MTKQKSKIKIYFDLVTTINLIGRLSGHYLMLMKTVIAVSALLMILN